MFASMLSVARLALLCARGVVAPADCTPLGLVTSIDGALERVAHRGTCHLPRNHGVLCTSPLFARMPSLA
ncbi:hypothetical protein VTI74DRAFT_3328 [Chaetomium olivicolor]